MFVKRELVTSLELGTRYRIQIHTTCTLRRLKRKTTITTATRNSNQKQLNSKSYI